MKIKYLNHSSFQIKTKYEGNKLVKLVTDPFNPNIGIKYSSTEADIVTVSHIQHDDHFYIDGIKNMKSGMLEDESFKADEEQSAFVVKTPGEYEVRGVHVKGISSYHDDSEGEERGKNVIYVIRNEGYSICHLGDLGHKLTDKQIEEIGDVNVLMVPVGGVYTIDKELASEVISQVQPGFVIPMHYKTENHNEDTFGELDELNAFLEQMAAEDIKPKKTFKVKKQTSDETEVIVLKPQYTQSA